MAKFPDRLDMHAPMTHDLLNYIKYSWVQNKKGARLLIFGKS